jgi:tetratricopeptide (TPR) repeat protein
MLRFLAVLLWTIICYAQQPAPHIKAAATEFQAGRKALAAGNATEAAQRFQKAVEIEPTFLEAYQGWLDADLKAGQRLQAGAPLTRLLQIEPHSVKHRLLLAQILCEQKQPERALAQYALILKQEPANADALAGFAATAKQLGMAERASEALEQGRKLHPADRRFNPVQQ